LTEDSIRGKESVRRFLAKVAHRCTPGDIYPLVVIDQGRFFDSSFFVEQGEHLPVVGADVGGIVGVDLKLIFLLISAQEFVYLGWLGAGGR